MLCVHGRNVGLIGRHDPNPIISLVIQSRIDIGIFFSHF
jgi:hypothetical protein